MQYMNTGTPTPGAPADQNAFLPGLPYQPPFVPQMDVGPNMQQFLPLVTGFALLELQQQAHKNPLRAFYFNLCSANSWRNPDVEMLIGGVSQFAEFLMATQRLQPEQAISHAANEMAGMMTSLTAQRFQQQLGQFITPQMGNDLGNQIQKFQQLTEQIQRFNQPAAAYNQYPNNAPGYNQGGRGYNNPNQPYSNPNMNRGPQFVGRGPAPMGGGNYGYGNPNPGAMAHTHRNGPDIWSQNNGMGHTNNVPPLGSNLTPGLKPRVRRLEPVANEELTMSTDGSTDHRVWKSSGREDETKFEEFPGNPTPAPTPFQRHDPVKPYVPSYRVNRDEPAPTHVSVSPEVTWPKVSDPLRPWDSIVFEDGSELRPAFKSGWKRTVNEEQPYSLVYDLGLFVKFHLRRPNGTVTETLVKRIPEMDYLQNELDPKLKAAMREAEPQTSVITPTWGLANKLRPHPTQPVAIPVDENAEPNIDLPSGDVTARVLDEVILAHSLSEAEVKVAGLSRNDASLRNGDAPFEFYYDQITPVFVANNVINTIRLMSDSQTFQELKTRMFEAKSRLPDVVWNMLDERLTNAINETMEKNVSLPGWKIDTFIGDFEDLMTAVANDYSMAFIDTFQQHAPEIIGGALSVLSGDSLDKYVRSITGAEVAAVVAEKGEEATAEDQAEGDDSHGFLLAFRDRCSITRVPWKLAELQLDLTQGGAIPESTMPELHLAVDAIFDRTVDLPVTFSRRYLQTADKKLLELRRGYLGKDSYLIFDAK